MEYPQGFRAFLVVALSVGCLVLPGRSISTPAASVVWFTDHRTLTAIDPETNTLAQAFALDAEPDALAVDAARNTVWILRGKHLTKLSATGVEILRLDLNHVEPGFGAAKLLALNPYSGSLWIAAERELLELSVAGEAVGHWRAKKTIDALALDADETLWVVANEELLHLGADATPLGSIDLGHALTKAQQLVVDALGGVLWIADKERVLRLDLHRLADGPQVVATTEIAAEDSTGDDNHDVRKIKALAVHPMLGTLWVATQRRLLLFDRSGNLLKTVPLQDAVEKANGIAFDPASASLWVAGKNGVARFTGSGELVSVFPADKEADHVAAGGFTLYPTVSILEPTDGALTNNPQPRLRLGLGSTCSGTPCLLPDAYTHSLHLDVFLNGTSIGAQFDIEGRQATDAPPVRLPEGGNTLVAAGTDLFGHRSSDATSRFTIDTIAPRFVSLAPVDGSAVSQAAVTIRGEVDDPTANVLLADGNGQGISLTSGATFSFAVLLKPGLNTFALTARDPAGNETTVPLRIRLNTVSLRITSPPSGTRLMDRATLVTGNLQGPLNTGITVNGAVAEVFGSRFYANLVLAPGANTLTAVATTPAGASVSDTVAVTVDAPSNRPMTITVEPQSGIAPLTVRFSAAGNTANTVTQLSVDANNDGTPEITGNNPTDPLAYVYATPGVYQMHITATDSNGATVTETLGIMVQDPQQIDVELRAIYDGMLANLRVQNIDDALSAISSGMRDRYRAIFMALRPNLSAVIEQLGALKGGLLGADMAEYVIVRNQDSEPRAFLIYFLRDEDGVWRVDGM